MVKSCEETEPGQLTSSDQRDAPDCMMLCSAAKAGGKEEEEGTLGFMVFVFPSHQ